MRYRQLGKTGITVSEIGLGTEHLSGQPASTYDEVFRCAVERGLNYVDVLMPYAEYRDNIGRAIRGIRDRLVIAGHIGVSLEQGQSLKTRDVKACRAMFEDLLTRLGTDGVDVVMLQWVDGAAEMAEALAPGGTLELAARLKREGKARAVGLSTHEPETAMAAAASGAVNLVMHPVNLTYSPQFASTANAVFGSADAATGKRAPIPLQGILDVCRRQEVGLVGMKPFGGGALFLRGRGRGEQERQKHGEGKGTGTGTGTGTDPAGRAPTPTQCLSFSLSHPEVSCALAGVRNVEQLKEDLHYLDAAADEKDFGAVLNSLGSSLASGCAYCNHCLPCPAELNVGETLRLLDMVEVLDAAQGGGFTLRGDYASLPVKASACTACGACSARCPFGVDVAAKMARAVEVFER